MVGDTKDGRKSVFALIGELPALISTLIRDEIEQIKREALTRLKAAGIGIGLFAGAAVFLYFAAFVLLAAIVAGIVALGLPVWLSALIVGVVLVLIAVVLALIGLSRLKKGVPPVPKESVESVKDDVKAFKGVGQFDR